MGLASKVKVMGDTTGFMKYNWEDFSKEPPSSRKKHWKEFIKFLSDEEMQRQAARCMNCGTPFCHAACPLGNIIPEWNDLLFRGRWKEAVDYLRAFNNFPEITGRICPALCESSCVLSIDQKPITIRNIEVFLIEKAYQEGWIKPQPPLKRTGKNIAIVGSGPAGLACADQLNKAGHLVTVYEKNNFLGGLLTLGIPDFKLEKGVVDRRINLMKEEGVIFKTGAHVGVDIRARYLQKENDALVLAGGAEWPRDLSVPGRELDGVYQAVRYLSQQNLVNRGEAAKEEPRISAKNKNVIVLGGGDTGADCVGTAIRQGAKSVKQFELLPRPPEDRAEDNPWPQWAFVYRKSTSHEEGVEQDFCILTKELIGENGKIKKLHAVRLEYGAKDPATGRRVMKEIPGSEFSVDCDMLILALGFLGPVIEPLLGKQNSKSSHSRSNGMERFGVGKGKLNKKEMIEELKLSLDERGNVKTDEKYMTSAKGVFAVGDMHRGQSLVVWAIEEGRRAAEAVNAWVMA